jgi:GDP-L-fucose synthase
MKMAARIFVAGHGGLIGSAMVRRLRHEGYANILMQDRDHLDLRIRTKVDEFFGEVRPEYVVLAAGRVGGIHENQTYPADFINDNLAVQLNVLSAAQQIGVKKLIFFGSSCMYPHECSQPMSEDLLLSGKPEPTSLPYAISKLAGTQMCLAYNRQYGEQRFIPVIPNSAYGPNDNFNPKSGHVLSALMARFHEAKERNLNSVTLWGTGSPRREFVHADDIADVCLRLLQEDVSALEFPLNIGVDADMSIKQLAEIIAEVVGYTGRLDWDLTKPDGAPRKLLDSARLRAFGWLPKVGFAEGLGDTYEWYVRKTKNTPAKRQ